MDQDKLDDIRLIDAHAVAYLIGRSLWTIDHWIRIGKFPRPIQARPGAKRQWKFATVRAWVEKRSHAKYRPPAPRGLLKRGQSLGRVRLSKGGARDD